MIIEYTRLRQDVQPPERANPSDAGLDLFFNPEPSGLLPSPNLDSIVINPGENKLLPTGYRFGIPHGYMLEIKNRSGVAAKRSLIVGACVVRHWPTFIFTSVRLFDSIDDVTLPTDVKIAHVCQS